MSYMGATSLVAIGSFVFVVFTSLSGRTMYRRWRDKNDGGLQYKKGEKETPAQKRKRLAMERKANGAARSGKRGTKGNSKSPAGKSPAGKKKSQAPGAKGRKKPGGAGAGGKYNDGPPGRRWESSGSDSEGDALGLPRRRAPGGVAMGGPSAPHGPRLPVPRHPDDRAGHAWGLPHLTPRSLFGSERSDDLPRGEGARPTRRGTRAPASLPGSLRRLRGRRIHVPISRVYWGLGFRRGARAPASLSGSPGESKSQIQSPIRCIPPPPDGAGGGRRGDKYRTGDRVRRFESDTSSYDSYSSSDGYNSDRERRERRQLAQLPREGRVGPSNLGGRPRGRKIPPLEPAWNNISGAVA
mmetsp:Transcript_62384/g.197629  ORF Transcript_62384/g.197629 Transcript_62384/m.197629 type:complete len:354 (+) Transcript_62384:342-1403(+)